MNKMSTKTSFLLGILLLICPVFVYATSGACSWHEGVNCGAGADWDGSVICNDGWKDSTVSFYSTSECFSTNISCTVSERESLYDKYGVTENLKKLELLRQESSVISEQIDQTKNNKDLSPLILQLNNNTRKQELLLLEIKLATPSIEVECRALGYDRERQKYLDNLKKQDALLRAQQDAILEQLKASSCPANSYYSGGKCFCNEGYEVNGNVCVVKDAIAPSGTLNISSISINLGEALKITVAGLDNKKMKSVFFKYDAKTWETNLCSDGGISCSYTWEVSGLTIGNHIFTGYVLDEAGNSSYTIPQSISVTVTPRTINKPAEEQKAIIESSNSESVSESITEEKKGKEEVQQPNKETKSELEKLIPVVKKSNPFLANVFSSFKNFFARLFR